MQDNNLKLAFASFGPELLDVRHFSVHEAMNELFEVSVLAHSEDENIDLDAIVGKGAALRLETPNYEAGARVKVWAGVVAHMSQVHAEPPPGHSAYHVLIVPTLWRATLRRNNRIYQHKTTPDIVKELLSEYGMTPVLKLQGDYKKHEYKVQYAESDFAFIARLLEDAGISFYFQSDGEKGKGEQITKLVLNDAPHLNAQRGGKLSYGGHQTPRFGGAEDFCATVTISQRAKPGRFTVRDFDFRLSPETPLFAKTQSGTREDVYEQYDYAPGALWWDPADKPAGAPADDKGPAGTNEGEGTNQIKRDFSALRRRRLQVSFHSNAIDLAPGAVMAINQNADTPPHPRDDLSPSKKLLLVSSSIEGEHGGEWSMHVSAVYAELPYRPERRTPKPRIYGVQSALVVGPKGSDIHVDQFGRVRVQFHWDRTGKYDDNSSCWMRVSNPWAGGAFGMINIPRVGHEVLVGFFEGDPDQPIITGRVYNSTTNVPYKLPDNATKSGWKTDSSPGGGGYNEISLEDKKGQELIHVQGQKDVSYVVNHDETSSVGVARTHTIGATDTLNVGDAHHVAVGHNNTRYVGDLDSVSVGPSTGIKIVKEKKIVLSTGEASITLDGANIFINVNDEAHIHSSAKLHLSSLGGMVQLQGGPNVRFNNGEKGPAPNVDIIDPARPPQQPTQGETSGPPYKPSGGTVVDKPGPIEDVSLGSDEEQAADRKTGSDIAGEQAKTGAGAGAGAGWVANHQDDLKKSLAEQKQMLQAKKAELQKWDGPAKENFRRYFGEPTEAKRQEMLGRIDRTLAMNEEFSNDMSHFQDSEHPKDGTYAYVHRGDTGSHVDGNFPYLHWSDVGHKMYLDNAFQRAPISGVDSKAGTLSHEMSHYPDVGGTKDHVYGAAGARQLAIDNPTDAMNNADSYEYYLEGAK